MTTRIEMADALLAKAKLRRQDIGDHGDPYEESLLSGKVVVELRIIVKEIFDHLRSSLDYMAKEVVSRYGEPHKRVYFPIVSKTFSQHDFKGVFGKVMPGVAKQRPDFVELFASFQPFSEPTNSWLSDFATLCNEAKHENLNVSNTEELRMIHVGTREDGVEYIKYEKKDGSPFYRSPLMVLRPSAPGSLNGTAYYISLTDIDEELLWFLDRSLAGVTSIIDQIRRSIT